MVIVPSCEQHVAPILDLIDSMTDLTEICYDNSSWFRLFEDGTFAEFVECAYRENTTFNAQQLALVPEFSWPSMRNVVCGSPVVADPAPAARTDRSWSVQVLFLVLGVGAVAALASGRRLLRRVQNNARCVVAWWLCVFGTVLVLDTVPTPHIDLQGFFYDDATTACAVTLRRNIPQAIVRDRFLTFLAPVRDAPRVFREIVYTTVHGVTLHDLCGNCGLTSIDVPYPNYILNVLYDIPVAPHDWTNDREVMLSILFPESTSAAWRRELALRLSDTFPPGSYFSTSEQAKLDIDATMQAEPWLGVASAAIVFSILVFSVNAPGRPDAQSTALVLCVVAALALVVLTSSEIARHVGVPPSPFNAMVFPIVLGTGVDSMMILLHARREGHRQWARAAMPSIVASQASTVLSFVCGTWLAVEHFYNFFLTAIITMVLSCAMQLTLFVALISFVRTPPVTTAPLVPLRLLKYLSFALLALPVASVPFLHRPDTSFSLTSQLHSGTMTHQFLARSFNSQMYTSPLYAYVDGPANFTRIHEHFRALNATTFVDWHEAWTQSAMPLEEWIGDPLNAIMYRWTLAPDLRKSAVIGSLPYQMGRDAAVDAAEATRIVSEDVEHVCFTNYERLGGYTVHEVFQRIWMLACASAVVSALVGTALVGRYGMCTCLALGYTYVLMALFLHVSHVNISMSVLAALLIGPGLVVDYPLHLTYNPTSVRAVTLSFLTSVGGMSPFVLSEVVSLRDFALVYIVFLFFGIVCALSSTTIPRVFGYSQMSPDESK